MLDENSIVAGRYQIVRRLASGGMGAVYEARHVETGRACALKVMLAHVAENSPARERFRLEARAAALVSSAHVVEVLDAGVHEATGSPFLVMELLRGEDLASRMQRVGPFSAADVAKFIFQAARGLDALHKAAIVHRDLKPSNLFLAKRDHTEIIKVLDLGVAKRVMDTAVTTAVVGTPLYMAPEQMANRKISPLTDQFALAMVAYSLLVGREYWAAEAETAASSIGFALLALDGPKESATERAANVGVQLPTAFDAWFRKATAKEPEERFSDVVAAALELCSTLGVDSAAWRGDLEHGGQISEEQAPRTFPAEAFAKTLANENAEKAQLKTMTLGDELPGAQAQTMGLAKTEADPKIEKQKRRKRLLRGIAGIGFLGLSALGFFWFRERNRNEVVAPIPIVNALQCSPAEITGPGASPHLADALAKGACARLGVELGVPWLVESKGMPLYVKAETREDRSAHVVLELAEQKTEGDGKTLIQATNEAIGKLAPLLKTPPMTPERIAGWGARDAASALRIEKAMRQKAFHFADRLEIAKKIVETDGDSPVSHAMLACAARHSDHDLAIREKKEALTRLSKLPAKRAQLVQAGVMNFIPTPDDPKDSGSIVDSYQDLGKDPDFATLYTMCGCVVTGVSVPMADWLAKNEPIMGMPILQCAMGGNEYHSHDPAERYLLWMKKTLPEWQRNYIERFVRLGWRDAARDATDLLEWLDMESPTSADVVSAKMLLAFGAFDAKKAISITEASFGEPDAETGDERAIEYVNSLIFAGKMRKGLEVGEQRIYSLWRAGKNESLADFAAEQLRLRRLLNRPALNAATLEWIEQARAKLPFSRRDALDVELTLLRAREKKNKLTKDSFASFLETIQNSDLMADDKHADTFRILREAHQNEAALAAYREIDRLDVYRHTAFEGGLAFEAVGKKMDAEIAYLQVVEQPWNHPFDAMAARLRVAEIMKADGRADEAQRLLKELDQAWIEADADLRDIVKRMK